MEFKDKIIFIISPNKWGNMYVSKHHYALELAKRGNKVYFINPPDLTSTFFKTDKIKDNLIVVNYYPIFRGKSFLPNVLFNLLVKLQISILINKIGLKPDVLWSFTTTNYYRPDWFKAKWTILHPMDQVYHKDSISIGNYVDVIFTCSDFILKEFSDLEKPKKLIPHGLSPSFADFEFKNWDENKLVNICYVGNLFIENLDRETLKTIIGQNPKHHFHFIGAHRPQDSNVSAWVTDESLSFIEFLLNSKNVVCYGVVTSEKIPVITFSMDAFLVCYKPSETNLISNSHKILEYLITGRVVITSQVEYYKKSNLVEMVSSEGSYFEKYTEITSNLKFYNRQEMQNKRKQYAMNNSYMSHIENIERYMSSNLLKLD